MVLKRFGFLCALIAALAIGSAHAELSGYEGPPVNYLTTPVNDPIAKLIQKLEKNEATFQYDEKFGWLPSLLKSLDIPASSQMLVFSKTSLQRPHIAPETPRAIYFSDNVYAAWVNKGEMLEIAAVDPQQGAVFYTLSQKESAKPVFTRQTHTCLQCHDSPAQALGVPGFMMRSVYPDSDGMPIYSAGTFLTTQESPFKERWGGWYVTGSSGGQLHMGNTIIYDRDHADKTDFTKGSKGVNLAKMCEIDSYLKKTSDIAALLVAEHQTRMHNYITNAGFEIRSALYQERDINKALGQPLDRHSDSTLSRVKSVAEPLLKYMLFSGESPMNALVSSAPEFVKEFSDRGPKDTAGRSLHELDLQHRLLKYPCSYLIYSESYNGLPEVVLEYLRKRLTEILSGSDQSSDYAHLTPEDRRAIREILSETWKGAPKEWRPAK